MVLIKSILNYDLLSAITGFPFGSAGKESVCNAARPGFDLCVGKILWRRERLLQYPGLENSIMHFRFLIVMIMGSFSEEINWILISTLFCNEVS